MSGSRLSSAELDTRRRRLLFRSWHRGTREADLILGGFADDLLPVLNDGELDQYEHLLDAPDTDLVTWVTGERPVTPEHDTPLFRRLLAHRAAAAGQEPTDTP